MEGEGAFRFTVDAEAAGRRLDLFLGERLASVSRSFAAELIASGRVVVDGRPRKPGYRLKAGECVSGSLPPPRPAVFRPEPIALDVLYEDEHLIVICKPPGMVVHPAPGHDTGTLVHALLHRCPTLEALRGELRPGIVHRLDKDTSGALVAAKDPVSLERLAAQFKSRSVEKRYLALAHGVPAADRGTVRMPIGRDPVDRKKMSVRSRKARPAETGWCLRRSWAGAASLLEVSLLTGRTHQIRVHLAWLGHPVVGDRIYGYRKQRFRLRRLFLHAAELHIDPVYGRRRAAKAAATGLGAILAAAPRQMLHAWRLSLDHPATGERLSWVCPLPPDMAEVIARLDAASAPAPAAGGLA